MRVTIDTKEDSHEDIQKVLQLLASMKNREPYQNPETTDPTPMMSMFDQPKAEVPDTPPNFNALLNLGKVDKDPKVELF